MLKRILCALVCVVCFGCSSGESKEESARKILVSIPPYATLVKAVVGDSASVEVVVPAGTNPHIYEPTPEQIKQFTKAQVWFRTGDPIEEKMVQFLKSYGVQIVDLSEKGATLGTCGCSGRGEHDLHLWVDPATASLQVEEMRAVLVKQFPEIGDALEERSQTVIDLLEKTDERIRARLSPFKGRALLVSHPALGYFCKRYGLEQLSIEMEGKDPLPQHVANLMHRLQKSPVPVVFTEPQYNNKGALLIAEKLHLPVEEIDPYAENYFEFLDSLSLSIMRHYDH